VLEFVNALIRTRSDLSGELAADRQPLRPYIIIPKEAAYFGKIDPAQRSGQHAGFDGGTLKIIQKFRIFFAHEVKM
jgi:hypothetical protein